MRRSLRKRRERCTGSRWKRMSKSRGIEKINTKSSSTIMIVTWNRGRLSTTRLWENTKGRNWPRWLTGKQMVPSFTSNLKTKGSTMRKWRNRDSFRIAWRVCKCNYSNMRRKNKRGKWRMTLKGRWGLCRRRKLRRLTIRRNYRTRRDRGSITKHWHIRWTCMSCRSITSEKWLSRKKGLTKMIWLHSKRIRLRFMLWYLVSTITRQEVLIWREQSWERLLTSQESSRYLCPNLHFTLLTELLTKTNSCKISPAMLTLRSTKSKNLFTLRVNFPI